MEEPKKRVWGRENRGRKTKAEELGLQGPRAELLKSMPRFGARSTELSVMNYLQRVSDGLMASLITAREAEALHKIASTALRAIRQRSQAEEMRELEGMYDTLKGQLDAVIKGAAQSRERTH